MPDPVDDFLEQWGYGDDVCPICGGPSTNDGEPCDDCWAKAEVWRA